MKRKNLFFRRKIILIPSLTIFFFILLLGIVLNLRFKYQSDSLDDYIITPSIINPSDEEYSEDLTETFKIEDLNGFPIYPEAKFLGKSKTVSCNRDVYAGEIYSSCSSFAFSWEVNEGVEKIENWYKENKHNSSWKCGPEVGGYTYFRVMTCQNGNLIYGLDITGHETYEEESSFVIKIPYEERKVYPIK